MCSRTSWTEKPDIQWSPAAGHQHSRLHQTRIQSHQLHDETRQKKQAREEVVLAEREFSTKYKLRKEDWVHPSILKKRTEFLK